MSTIDQDITRRYESEPLFSSAHAALVFAFNFSMDLYDRPLMNKMADPPAPVGKGLSGLDGAAQAGFVRAELHLMGAIPEAILIARVAPQGSPCECRRPCCSGKTINPGWADAIKTLTQHALVPLSGCISHYRLRAAIVQKFFGASVSLSDIAEVCGVNRDTASDHNQKVVKMLRTEETAAWGRFESRLIEAGMVESVKNS